MRNIGERKGVSEERGGGGVAMGDGNGKGE